MASDTGAMLKYGRFLQPFAEILLARADARTRATLRAASERQRLPLSGQDFRPQRGGDDASRGPWNGFPSKAARCDHDGTPACPREGEA